MKRIGYSLAVMFCLLSAASFAKTKHPFDLFTPEVHGFHNDFFEAAGVGCETCHKDPENFADRSKMNRLGCHICHNNPNPPAPASQECTRCHIGGKFPKPASHKAGWIAKHQDYAKQNVGECAQCHRNNSFCINCHQRRDSIQQIMHRRNFLFYHSVEARANPRKCDECHTTSYCQRCHSGKGP